MALIHPTTGTLAALPAASAAALAVKAVVNEVIIGKAELIALIILVPYASQPAAPSLVRFVIDPITVAIVFKESA